MIQVNTPDPDALSNHLSEVARRTERPRVVQDYSVITGIPIATTDLVDAVRQVEAVAVIGIATSTSDFNPCHRQQPELVRSVANGIIAAGGLPMEFPTVSLGESFLEPTSMVYRNLMAMDVEALGMALPDSATAPAVHADRLRIGEAKGVAAVEIAAARRTPSQVVTSASVRNALRDLLAIGGSTNVLIHLTAMVGRLGLRIDPDELNELSSNTPVLVELKPTGAHYMEDLHASGGLPSVLHELRDLLDLSALTVTGETLGERLGSGPVWVDREVVRPLDSPSRAEGGLVWLRGSLAPSGALIKRSGADPELFETTGRAVVFSSSPRRAAGATAPTGDGLPAPVPRARAGGRRGLRLRLLPPRAWLDPAARRPLVRGSPSAVFCASGGPLLRRHAGVHGALGGLEQRDARGIPAFLQTVGSGT